MTSNVNDGESRKGDSPRNLAEAEAALRESEERYALALQGSNDGIWDWNIVTGEVFFSDRWKAILGYDPNEISNKVEEWKTRIHPEDFDRVMASHRENFEGKTPHFEVEYRLRHKDGSYRWILGRGACLRDDRGVPIRAAGSHTDITAKKRTEETIRWSEERLKAILSSLPDLIFRIDREGTFLDFHTPSPDQLAVPPERFLGKRLPDIMPQEIARESLRLIAETLRTGEVSPVQEYRLSVGGRLSDFEARFVQCGSDEVIAIIRDITVRMQAEETIRKNAERQRQVQKFEAIGRMAGGLAHHLNNLMTVVTGYSELLLTQVPEADPRHGEIAKIRVAGERAAELTRQLLAFSRLQVLRPREVDVNLFISHLSAALRNLAGPFVRFTFSLGDSVGAIQVDPDHLRRTLTHLVANARDAMPGGGELRVITAEVEQVEPIEGVEPARGRYALLTVQDTGCGMDTEARNRIFEPFYSLKEGREGMGLPSVYGFIKQSGGYITVDSRPGDGTRFRIYFPCLDRTADSVAPGETPLAGTPAAG